jgi:hypothetical protein
MCCAFRKRFRKEGESGKERVIDFVFAYHRCAIVAGVARVCVCFMVL